MTEPHFYSIHRLIRGIEKGIPPESDDELDALAEQALKALEERKGEDIEEWARRLAADVADAND